MSSISSNQQNTHLYTGYQQGAGAAAAASVPRVAPIPSGQAQPSLAIFLNQLGLFINNTNTPLDAEETQAGRDRIAFAAQATETILKRHETVCENAIADISKYKKKIELLVEKMNKEIKIVRARRADIAAIKRVINGKLKKQEEARQTRFEVHAARLQAQQEAALARTVARFKTLTVKDFIDDEADEDAMPPLMADG